MRSIMSENMPSDICFAERPHILIVDDDQRICALVARYLDDHGFVPFQAHSAVAAREVLACLEVDALVVDVMMPGESGTDLTRSLRGSLKSPPVLLLTALGETGDRIQGLEAGADDYLAKPFDPRELVLRLNAILRRTRKDKDAPKSFMIGPWRFDSSAQRLTQGTQSVPLSAAEVSLIQALAARGGEVLSRDDIARATGMAAAERTVDVQITRLRKKLRDDGKAPRYLQTVRGKGYRLRIGEAL